MSVVRVVLAAAFVWLMVAGLIAIQFWPHLPQSGKQWAAFVALGPPVYVAIEGAFGWLFSRRHGEAISAKRFSVTRVLLALLATLLFVAAFWWVALFLGAA